MTVVLDGCGRAVTAGVVSLKTTGRTESPGILVDLGLGDVDFAIPEVTGFRGGRLSPASPRKA